MRHGGTSDPAKRSNRSLVGSAKRSNRSLAPGYLLVGSWLFTRNNNEKHEIAFCGSNP